VVRCPDPEQPGKYVVGRILGEQGDRIVAETGNVTVNEKFIGTRRACIPPQISVVDPKTSEAVELSCEIEEAGGTEYTRLRATTPPLNPTPYKSASPMGRFFWRATTVIIMTTRATSAPFRKRPAISASFFGCGAPAAGSTTRGV